MENNLKPKNIPQRVIKFKCIVVGNNKEIMGEFHEWLDEDGWNHDYYFPFILPGVFSQKEFGDGFFGETIRLQFTGAKDCLDNDIYEGDIIEAYHEVAVKKKLK